MPDIEPQEAPDFTGEVEFALIEIAEEA